MFENPVIFSLIMGLIVSIGYLIYYKNKENKEKKKNSVILFSIVFVLSLIINICFVCNDDDVSLKKVGGFKKILNENNNISPSRTRDIPPF
jgi:hypothetical protein